MESGIKLFGDKHLHGAILSHGKVKLFIYHPHDRTIKPIEFNPDMVFTLPDKKKYVFQILDSQLDKKREIEADVFRAFLCAEVSRLVFIIPDRKSLTMVRGIVDIISDTLWNYGVRKETLPIVLVVEIPKDIKKAKTIVRYLEKIEKDKDVFKQI